MTIIASIASFRVRVRVRVTVTVTVTVLCDEHRVNRIDVTVGGRARTRI